MLLIVVFAAAVACAMLLAKGSLAFTAMPLLMALAALGLAPRVALLAGAAAATIVVGRTVVTALWLDALSAAEWLCVLIPILAWAAALAVVAWSRRAFRWGAALPVLLASPLFIAAVVPLNRALDPVQRSSVYLTMRDSVRIAADVYLPRGVSGKKLPAILHQTRYFRRVVMHWPYSLLFGGSVRSEDNIRRFVKSGYAYVSLDVRGSGASFGSRLQDWSDDEIRDGAQVVDWIVGQPWSSGKVGCSGISYDGAACEMLLANRHPAVKAAAPRFSVLDPYADVSFPGGIHFSWFTENWAKFNNAADRDALTELLEGFEKRIVKGVAPVDGQEHLLEQAVADHQGNYDLVALLRGATYRDDTSASGSTWANASPFAKSAIAASKVPIYSFSGWYDGALHCAAISRFLSYGIPGSRLIIGPWDHGGRQNISPHEPPGTPLFDQPGELIRFFDLHLKGVDDGIGRERPVRYYTMGEEAWKEADTWPPAAEPRTLYFAANHALSDQPQGQGVDEYRVDLTATSGVGSRWRSYFNRKRAPIGYPDRAEQDKKLLTYNSAPLTEDWEITGHPSITVWLESSAPDGQIFAYLEEVTAEGRVIYISEGLLRALHRKISTAQPPYWQPLPLHSFARADGQPLAPGEPAEIAFALLPTSYRVQEGSSLRVALAGADVDQFAPMPGEPPLWRVYRNSAQASRIVLPVVSRKR